MALPSSVQAQIAFKNLLGKSQTETNKQLAEEAIGYSFDVPSENVTLDFISSTASESVSQGVAVLVTATLSVVLGTNNKAYQTYWPTTPPSGTDIRTGGPFNYGVGSLLGISGGDKMTNLISNSYGDQYLAVPYDVSGTRIGELDSRDWVYQYNSGVFYQNNVTPTTTVPSKIDVYAYIGSRLSDLSLNTQTNIRVTATGSISAGANIYFATYSTPTISTYSSNYLFLIDFPFSNTVGTVSLNINSIGTASVFKYTSTGRTNLLPGDIVGATGGTAGQTYYLVYTNGYFEFYSTNPISNPSSYTNPVETSNLVGGIDKGTSFTDVRLQQMFEDLLYPERLGNISGFTVSNTQDGGVISSLQQVGRTFSADVFTFSWSFTNIDSLEANSLKIEDSEIATPLTQSSPISALSAGFSSAYMVQNVPYQKTYKLTVTRTNGTNISKTIPLSWVWKLYYGSSTFSSLTSSQIVALGGSLATQSIGSWTVSGSGYKYFAVPEDSSYNFNNITYNGLPLAIAGTSSSYNEVYGDLNFSYVTVSNIYNREKRYKVYRSFNQIGATISINISN